MNEMSYYADEENWGKIIIIANLLHHKTDNNEKQIWYYLIRSSLWTMQIQFTKNYA